MDNRLQRKRTHPYNLRSSIKNTTSSQNSQTQSRRQRRIQNNSTRRQYDLRDRVVAGNTIYDYFDSAISEIEYHFGINHQLRRTVIRDEPVIFTDKQKHKKDNIEKRIEKFDSFILKEASEENHCNICMDDEAKDFKMIRLTCNHEFCKSCLKNWFKNKLSCPICRHEYSLQED